MLECYAVFLYSATIFGIAPVSISRCGTLFGHLVTLAGHCARGSIQDYVKSVAKIIYHDALLTIIKSTVDAIFSAFINIL